MELTILVKRDTRLEAVFLCIIPFLAALSVADMASFKAACALSLFLLAASFSTVLFRVFSLLFTDLFFNFLASDCRALLMADMFFSGEGFAANVLPPCYGSINVQFLKEGRTCSPLVRTNKY